jgi:hypothetical protein
MTRDMERGAWFAFDCVLSWINTQDTRLIDKHALYRAVSGLRPCAIAQYQEGRTWPARATP